MTKTTNESSKITYVIYAIPCQCGQDYIGEIKRPINIKIQKHKNNVTKKQQNQN